jgi:hypothetical protein
MFGRKILTELSLRKRALIIEGNLNRLQLRNDWADLRAATSWFTSVAGASRKFGSWLKILAPLAGIWAGRRATQSGSPFGRILRAAGWARSLWSLWQTAAATRSSAEKSEHAEPI